jgi:hypothetical protein
MTDRDMSYELDASFASRNDGEVQNVAQPRTRFARSPGLTIRQPNAALDDDAVDAVPVSDVPRAIDGSGYGVMLRDAEGTRDLVSQHVRRAGGLSDLEIDLPIIGKVNLLHVGVAVAATLLVCKMMKKSR